MIKPNTSYEGQGVMVTIEGKEYPLIRTTAKMAFYDVDGKEKRISLKKVNSQDSESKSNKKGSKKSNKVSNSNSGRKGPVGNGNFGGHMSHVPESCTHKSIFKDDNDIRWIDNQICYRSCKVKKCDRWREYRKETASKVK